jgi:hypothetical protein
MNNKTGNGHQLKRWTDLDDNDYTYDKSAFLQSGSRSVAIITSSRPTHLKAVVVYMAKVKVALARHHPRHRDNHHHRRLRPFFHDIHARNATVRP